MPFQKSLENYLNQPEVWAEVTRNCRQKDIMEDFCDGTYSSENSVLQQHPNALQILLNTDSLEIVNPIGSHTKKHKINVFYWTLANIQPQMWSKWSNIHMLGICKTKYLKKHGTKTFLIDFIETLLKLKEGIWMQVCGSERCLYGILTAVLADTPAGCIHNGDEAIYIICKKGCRTCNINTPEIQTKIRLSDLEERCPVLHRQRCSDLQEMPERLRPYWSKQWGINGTSPLLQLPYFKIAHCTPHDPLHVCLESVFNYATALILQIGLEAKLFTINWINAKIANFRYSYLDRDNKPEAITRAQLYESMSLKQTAAGLLTLNYILLFILQEKFDHLDRFYRNYMHLVAIVTICCSPYCTADTGGELQVLIECYLHKFKTLFPTKQLKPKHHFLLHLPTQIMRFGPLAQPLVVQI